MFSDTAVRGRQARCGAMVAAIAAAPLAGLAGYLLAPEAWQSVAASLAAYAVIFLAAVWADTGRSERSAGGPFIQALCGVMCAFGCMPLATVVSNAASMFFPGYAGSSAMADLVSAHGMAVALFVLAAVPAACEELAMRGAIYGTFRQRSAVCAVAWSTVLFAAIHGSAAQFAAALPCGLVLGLLRWSGGSLVPCVSMHFTFNALSVLYTAYGDGSWSGVPAAVVIAGGLACAMCIMALWLPRRDGLGPGPDRSVPACPWQFAAWLAAAVAIRLFCVL